ncbi:MAG: DoxX family protein [Bdellovibrionales bacterium]|nr:DoxX family protein [Bdellovibrionales bacterium]
MNIALWVIQGLLAAMFVMAGMMKAFQYEKAKEKLPWVKDVSKSLVTFIGISELLGGIGLIAPQAAGILPILTPVAAIGLSVIMLLAARFHLSRKEMPGVITNLFILALAAFVAYGRLSL